MPNHTANNFTVSGPKDDVLRFVADAKGEKGELDFNSLFPMPKELVGTTSPTRIQTQKEIDALWAEWQKKKDSKCDTGPMGLHSYEQDAPFNLGITQEASDALIAKYGCNNWYDWTNRNWGTKWGAYDVTQWSINAVEVNTLAATIYYETAWSLATAFWLNVSEKYPTLEFYHEYADEGGEFLVNETIVTGSVMHEEELDWESDDGITLREGLGRYSSEDEDDDEDLAFAAAAV